MSEMSSANPVNEVAKLLIVVGVILTVVGVLLLAGGRLPFGLGRLPGDISYRGRNGSFYFPIVTSIVLSVALSLVMWIVSYFRR